MSGEALRASLASLRSKLGREPQGGSPAAQILASAAPFVVLAVLGSLAVAGAPALAAAVAANPSDARLQGQFLLAGHVTAANGVRAVHSGQNGLRTWTFTPGCAIGACDTVTLVRGRSGGSDTVVLIRRAPGYYAGVGLFYVPLRCGRRTYARGQAVPFTIGVRVSAAVVSTGIVFATRLEAFYMNRSRTNLTSCVTPPAYVTATYHGHLVSLTPPTGGTGP